MTVDVANVLSEKAGNKLQPRTTEPFNIGAGQNSNTTIDDNGTSSTISIDHMINTPMPFTPEKKKPMTKTHERTPYMKICQPRKVQKIRVLGTKKGAN